ncbi:UDP-glucose/GDP-mannose dehydrogenase family protein [Tumebacillus sp. ITR2]|uniref:UDP-glucose 6-dehydrogenase n=1 Tax=Tumebacillus amylolyticus TaxID=2801339 RepID=A0ABS1JEH2_9BACL|nr:UDP-glucose/GDP-mannose dehydrogenase family protein [Tumebacillus amylolyticus]MBL0388638.1 UDP-glucose/GDP-mannose dehydrogenase family protein [Tumebacillus amylolyticus]
MKITVVGTGYVGTTTTVALAMSGHTVCGVDVDPVKVQALQNGHLPIFEEGLQDALRQELARGRLTFTCDLGQVILDSDVVLLAVGTPPDADGSADLTALEAVARQLGRLFQPNPNQTGPIVAVKSTVPVGTGARVRGWIQQELTLRGVHVPFEMASNPEFLREGRALHDALHPDRVVIGADTPRAAQLMESVYLPLGAPQLVTSIRDAEMIKYASNAFLATKISFMNELARLCERVGANIQQVAHGMGWDARINPHFLQAGIGYGGSCFPKDVQALQALASQSGLSLQILQAVESVNRSQPGWFLQKVKSVLGPLHGLQITVLGLTFKPGTDDIRESPAIPILKHLEEQGAHLTAYDPKGMAAMKQRFPSVLYASNLPEALRDADAVLLLTEWKEVVDHDWASSCKELRQPFVFDGRNVLNAELMHQWGYSYYGVARH